MAELHTTTILQNTDNIYVQTEDDNSTIRQVLADIERLMEMLSNELDQNKSSISSNLINYSPQQLKITSSLCYPTSSTTITSVTITDDNHQLIEHLRHRIAQLEHERNVLLTSYQLLIKLLK
ncbi:unnamed protein product [Rotaria sp. Silwood2]|nr:unnamed protein product [Rotaria sp. Silwood2]CAF2631817.1 unnamed protein product [Rotaria sp. Silwood2]CAF2876736.1 unnamed protein product [Rotaria sp. Silwood2]CAF3045635.1 unnamed protein product [Rotaria sp. Silwood2]CAF3878310.1 unnamed protein product [Rotaria sp. Silwood2]